MRNNIFVHTFVFCVTIYCYRLHVISFKFDIGGICFDASPLKIVQVIFLCARFKVEEVRKVVDSELGFVADVPYRRSGAKVRIDYAVLLSWL